MEKIPEAKLSEWEKIFREGFNSNDYTLTEYLEKFYEPPRLKSHPEQGEQGELYRLIKHVAECAFNSRVQIEGSAGFEVWWQEELKMNRKLREIESKLSSPPPEGQDERIKELEEALREIEQMPIRFSEGSAIIDMKEIAKQLINKK